MVGSKLLFGGPRGRLKFWILALNLSFIISHLSWFTAPANSTLTSIAFEDVRQNHVVLGELASRSRNAQLTRSGSSSPFTMSALATTYRGAYDYQTDAPYGATSGTGHSSCTVNSYSTRGCLVQLRESDERANSSVTFSGTKTGTDTNKTNIIDLSQTGSIVQTPTGGRGPNQMANGEFSFASIFGPEIYSVPFEGSPGQAVTYQWRATGSGDDYEIYGFLVKISNATGTTCTSSTGAGSYGLANPTTTHTILTYGRGKSSNWTTTTGTITESACYRFRFVGGTYDASGGYVVGGTFRIFDVKIGLAQNLTFSQPSDLVRSGTDRTFTAQATSNAPGATLVYNSDTTNVCTVSGSTVTVKANQVGTCTLRVDSAAVGSYGAAQTTYTSFLVLAETTRPVSSGGDSVSGDAKVCSTLSVNEGSWSDGGETITSTTYQWKRNGVAIIGATSSTYVIDAADSGNAISYDITKTNIKGSTTATSSAVLPVDTRAAGISMSVGTLSPAFNSCSFVYNSSIATRSITLTPTLASTSATVTVNGVSAVSGQASGTISLTAGSNSILVVVTNGTQSSSYSITINYAQTPSATMLAPTNVTGSGATLNAVVNANGQNTSNIFFEISRSASFNADTATITAIPSSASGLSDTNVSATAPSLTQETTYYVRVYATNATGTTISESFSFTTPAAPFVTTMAAETLTSTSVILKGTVVGNGDVNGASTNVVFEYSSNANLTGAIEVSPASNGNIPGGSQTSTDVTRTVTGLQTGLTYFYRLKASNNYGTNFGSTLTFTLVDTPTVTTQAASNITTNSASLNGTVNANSLTTSSIVFQWGTSIGNLNQTLSATPTTASGNQNTAVVGTLSGLQPNTIYYYRVAATNSLGTSLSSPITSFTTLVDARPSATLSAPSNSLLNQPFTVTVSFSEAVTGFASGDLQLSGSSSGWTAQIAQQISASLYTVEFRPTLSPAAGSFTIGLPQNVVLDSASQGNTAASSITVLTTSSVIPPDISYTSSTITATENSPITPLIPTNTGGIIASWSISSPPSLPGGLTFSTSNGQFSGTPNSAFPSTSFVITATNSAGSDTATITIVVNASVPAPSPAPSTPSPTVPDSPTNVSATLVGLSSASISFAAPANNGGSSITSYLATSSPGGLTGSISQFGSGTILINGLASATSYSFTVVAINSIGASTPSSSSNTITTATSTTTGLVPAFSSVTPLVDGFIVNVTNFNSEFVWSLQVAAPARAVISNSGVIIVSGLSGQGITATITVTTSRAGYTTEVGTITGATASAPPPPNFLLSKSPPSIAAAGNIYVCTPGEYEFLRENRFSEPARLNSLEFKLFVENLLIASVNVYSIPQFHQDSSAESYVVLSASMDKVQFDLSRIQSRVPAHCEVLARQENATARNYSNILTKATPSVNWQPIAPISETDPVGNLELNASSNVPGFFTYSLTQGTKLPAGRHRISASFTPLDQENFSSVVVQNELRVLPFVELKRNQITVEPSGTEIHLKLPTGSSLRLVSETISKGPLDSNGLVNGIKHVAIDESRVRISPIMGFTGKTELVFEARSSNAISRIRQPLLVLPETVDAISAKVNSLTEVVLNWPAVIGAVRYSISDSSGEICSTNTNSCTSSTLIGPKSNLSVQVVGNDQSSATSELIPGVTADFIAAIVNFEIGSFEVSQKSKWNLMQLSKIIEQVGFSRILLTGHTDNLTGINNRQLSLDRAKSVSSILSEYLPQAKIGLSGKGASSPIASNMDSLGKAANRRVEIKIVEP